MFVPVIPSFWALSERNISTLLSQEVLGSNIGSLLLYPVIMYFVFMSWYRGLKSVSVTITILVAMSWFQGVTVAA